MVGAVSGPDDASGRWPANILTDGSAEVAAAFPDAAGQQRATGPEFESKRSVFGAFAEVAAAVPRGDSSSAARFFYSSKADAEDRMASKHPTVKPVDLMQWLVRLVTPPGGTILDPFSGSGSTGEAAWREGFRAILIEREAEYQADIARRMALAPSSLAERRVAVTPQASESDLPLFGAPAACVDEPPPSAEVDGRSTATSPIRTPEIGTNDRPDRAQAMRSEA